MTNLDDILWRGSCAKCGAGVHLDDREGRVACDGCDIATDNCTCGDEDGDGDGDITASEPAGQ